MDFPIFFAKLPEIDGIVLGSPAYYAGQVDRLHHFLAGHFLQEVEKAYQEYDIFNKTQPIESDFDKIVKGLEKKK